MITSESYDQFSERVKKAIKNYSIEEIGKIIKSMPNRIKKRSMLLFLFMFIYNMYVCIYMYIYIYIYIYYRLNLHEISFSLKVKSAVEVI